MNIVVCVKHAIDEYELKIDEKGRPQLETAQRKMSAFDKNAIEEAIRIKESKGGQVSILTVGGSDSRKTIKEALAMGADKGCLVLTNPEEHDTLTTSYFLSKAVSKIGFDLVLCAEGASDTYHGQVGAMMAEWSGLPYIGYARKIEIRGERVRCEVSLEDRIEVKETKMPAVISVVSEINEARYPTLLQIVHASKKPIEELTIDSLKDAKSPTRSIDVVNLTAQSVARKRIIFEDTPEEAAKRLIDALTKEGVLKR
jgi:electron transfer flavoprotein beta subunit